MNGIADPAFRRAVERLHALGVRPLAELLIEIDADPDVVARYARLDPTIIRALGADRWPPAPIHEIEAAA